MKRNIKAERTDESETHPSPKGTLSRLREAGRCLGVISLPNIPNDPLRSHKPKRRELGHALLRLSGARYAVARSVTDRVLASDWRRVVQGALRAPGDDLLLELAAWLAVERLAFWDGHQCREDARLCGRVIALAARLRLVCDYEIIAWVCTALMFLGRDSESADQANAWRASWHMLLDEVLRSDLPPALMDHFHQLLAGHHPWRDGDRTRRP